VTGKHDSLSIQTLSSSYDLARCCEQTAYAARLEEGRQGPGRGAEVRIQLHAVPQPQRDVVAHAVPQETVVAQNDGPVVVLVPDDAPDRLVDSPARARIGLLTGIVHCRIYMRFTITSNCAGSKLCTVKIQNSAYAVPDSAETFTRPPTGAVSKIEGYITLRAQLTEGLAAGTTPAL